MSLSGGILPLKRLGKAHQCGIRECFVDAKGEACLRRQVLAHSYSAIL
jgi:hypothetical protein